MSRFVDLYCFFENRKTRQEAKVVLDIAFGKSAPTVKCVRSWYKRYVEFEFRFFGRFVVFESHKDVATDLLA